MLVIGWYIQTFSRQFLEKCVKLFWKLNGYTGRRNSFLHARNLLFLRKNLFKEIFTKNSQKWCVHMWCVHKPWLIYLKISFFSKNENSLHVDIHFFYECIYSVFKKVWHISWKTDGKFVSKFEKCITILLM